VVRLIIDRGMALFAAPLLFLFPAAAGAQELRILGRDNPDFARLLYETGYADLAEGLCATIKASDASSSDRLKVEALEFDLSVEQIRRDPDLVSRLEALRGVIERENEFLAQHARTSVADVVRANLPALYLEYAGALAAALDREEDAARRVALVEEGEQVFTEGETVLKERIERFTAQLDEGTGNRNYAERQLQAARFSMPRMEYHHSLLYAEGTPERTERLKSALKQFKDFCFDYPETAQNYQGIIYQGLCNEALGEFENALLDYEDAIALRELFVEQDGVYQVGPDEADLISGATLQLVRLLTRLKRPADAVAAADDFVRSIPDAHAASSGPEVLAAKAEAEMSAGDFAAASATAQGLSDLDPQGWAGRTGRELLARMPVGGLAPDKLLRIAETSTNRGEFGRALDLLRRTREAAAGQPNEQDIGASAYFQTGRVFGYLGRMHEASLAYDNAFEFYPEGAQAPEALNAAVNAYRQLASKEKSRFYAERADKRMNSLAQRYPDHPLAANAGIWQGIRREDEGDFAAAIDFYTKINPSSPSYPEASYRLANAFHEQARKLAAQDQEAAAQQLQRQAEEQYLRSMDLLKQAKEGTLDAALQQRYNGYALSSRRGLAGLYLDLGRPKEVLPLLEGQETGQNLPPDVVANIWSLRIRALEADQQLDQATKLFESVLQENPNAPGLASAAGVLARALDRAAAEKHDGKVPTEEVADLWRKAAHFYWLSVKSSLEGGAPLDSGSVSEVARRLYVIGLFFNGVPEGQQTFVDWQGTVAQPELWQDAARIYEALDAQAPSYLISIERARTLALLGQVAEAEQLYARLFDQNPIVAENDPKGFDLTAIETRPELVPAYLEWGVASHLVGGAEKNATLLDRASQIYVRLLGNTKPSARSWWQAKFFQIKLLMERGDYVEADTAIRNVKRTTDPDYDKGLFGFKDKFKQLEAEIKKKVF
jgi:tetratricopeptide (TPR) repeat protein